MMMRALTLFLATSLLCLPAGAPLAAQQAPATLTLEEAVRLARRHNPTYRAAATDENPAAWGVAEAYGAFLPTVSVSSDLSYQQMGTPRIGGLSGEDLGLGRTPAQYYSSYGLNVGISISGAIRSQVSATAARTPCSLGPLAAQSRDEPDLFAWDDTSTYIKHPPYFEDMQPAPGGVDDIEGARVLALLGDSITTDHISPAGSIKKDSPAGRYLLERNVPPKRLQLVWLAARQPRGDDARHVRQRWLARGGSDPESGAEVATVPGSSFFHEPALGRSLVRFAFCKREETLRAAAARLQRIARQHEQS